MRVLTVLVVLAGLAWGGWWFIAAKAAKTAAQASIDQMRSHGITVDHADLTVQGFPNRIDLTIPEPALRGANWAWRSEFLQVFSLSYKPWHLIATVAPVQTMTTPAGDLRIESPRLRASLIARPNLNLPLDRFALEAEPITAQNANGTRLSADTLALASRATPALDNTHDIGLRVNALRLPAAFGTLPDLIDLVLIESQVTFDAPLDRHAPTTRPQPRSIALNNFNLAWDSLRLHGTGQITPDAQGLTQGEITLRITNWKLALPILVSSGAIAPDFVRNLETALGFLSRRTADGQDELTLPLTLGQGRMSLGPLPLGPAPAFPRW